MPCGPTPLWHLTSSIPPAYNTSQEKSSLPQRLSKRDVRRRQEMSKLPPLAAKRGSRLKVTKIGRFSFLLLKSWVARCLWNWGWIELHATKSKRPMMNLGNSRNALPSKPSILDPTDQIFTLRARSNFRMGSRTRFLVEGFPLFGADHLEKKRRPTSFSWKAGKLFSVSC